ncbi:MAG: beta-Ala-His dipeptidase [Candidatus Latescibacteria bacterium]|nr:beta-Ala-His dipeptidase [bacterium]MBD3424401.1 beta-Ala-His dipeptidase [Candidatus Latescibacterota bacterium]
MPFSGLKPEKLWEHFSKILEIPHCSGNEEKLAEHLLSYAGEKGFEADKDEAGNVVIRVPASEGKEDAPTVVLQGHLDMVCEKNSDVDVDFMKDGITAKKEGDWITAEGTTLGADNGVGLAAALAIADDESAVHGPLEILATVSEEVGLIGAGELQPGFLEGEIMLNLDSEEIGEVYIGCAGGGDSVLRLPLEMVDVPSGAALLSVKVKGLRGGHSGIDIIEQRGNAIKVLARVLSKIGGQHEIMIGSIQGGSKRNAIPREAAAVIALQGGDSSAAEKIVSDELEKISAELGGTEENMDIVVEEADEKPGKVVNGESAATLLNLLIALPHGVETMSYDIEGLVETSNNLATIKVEEGKAVIGTSTRSSIASALHALSDRITAVAKLAGAEVEEEAPYPGWKPNLQSKILALVKKVHKREFGEEPEMKAIHAGLECGIIGEKFSGMDMVSFGPWIEHPHSPDERVNIPSVETFWKLLKAVLKEVAA